MARGENQGHWEIITIRSGEVEEKSKHFVAAEPDQTGERKKTSAKKQALNDANAARRAARWLNANFATGSVLLGLDYDDRHLQAVEARAKKLQETSPEESWEDLVLTAAEHELRLCIDRVRRKLRGTGVTLKYMAWTSDMDGKTGEAVRVHHHLVIPAACLEAFREKWGKGRCVGKPIQDEDLSVLAGYLCDQVRRRPDARKYMPSRNLTEPTVSRRVAVSGAELRVPKGCRLLYRGAHEPGWTSQYIRYLRRPEKTGTKPSDGGFGPERSDFRPGGAFATPGGSAAERDRT